MSTLDEKVALAIAHLEELEETLNTEQTEAMVYVGTLLPEEELKSLMIEIAEQQMKDNEIHINMHRAKCNAIKNFKEKKSYFEETLRLRELGYKVVTEKLQRFLQNPKVKPPQAWVQPGAEEEIKNRGVKEYLRQNMLYGNLL